MSSIKKTIGEIVLVTPLMATFLWFSGIIIRTKNEAATGMLLSPGKTTSMVTWLFLFIIIYSIFLFILLLDMHKKDTKKHKTTKKTQKKPQKKK